MSESTKPACLTNDIDAIASSPKSSSATVKDTLRIRFNRGVFWSMVAAIAASGSSLVFNIVIARLLGRERFGQFGMVQSTIATVAGIAQLATGYTATKFVAEFRSSDPARTGRVIKLCAIVSTVTATIAAVGLCLGAPLLAEASLRAPALSGPIRLAAAMVFFAVLSGYQIGTLAGLESYRALAVVAIMTGCINLAAAVLCAHYWGLNGAIAGLAIGSLFQWLAFRLAIEMSCRKEAITLHCSEFWSERTLFLSFALPAALSGLSSMPALWLANAFLVRQDQGFSEMGLYAAALNIRGFVFFLPTLLNRVSMSLLNNQKGLSNWQGYQRVFRTNIALTGGCVVIGAVAMGLVGARALAMFGKDFAGAYPVLLLVLASAVPEAMAMAMVQVVHSQGRLWLSFFAIALPKDCSLVLLSFLLTPHHGAAGLAAGYAGAWSITLISVFITARMCWPRQDHA